jgi:hypothetical protein
MLRLPERAVPALRVTALTITRTRLIPRWLFLPSTHFDTAALRFIVLEHPLSLAGLTLTTCQTTDYNTVTRTFS